MLLVDSSVLIDVIEEDSPWRVWSAARLAEHAPEGLAINQIIYAEVSVGFGSERELEQVIGDQFYRLDLPWEAAFLAGKAFLAYRRSGGTRAVPLPDFFIGAHARVAGLKLVTRDATRYRTYFPDIEIVAP